MLRVQFLIPEDEKDRFESHVYNGLRARVIRNLLIRVCDAIESPENPLTPDDLIRGDFKLEEHDYGNF